MNNFGLSDEVVADIKNAVSKYPCIEQIKIFGSRAKGNFKRYSDIDLAIFGAFDADVLIGFKDCLEELDVIYRFDVVHYEMLQKGAMREHIDRVGIAL